MPKAQELPIGWPYLKGSIQSQLDQRLQAQTQAPLVALYVWYVGQ